MPWESGVHNAIEFLKVSWESDVTNAHGFLKVPWKTHTSPWYGFTKCLVKVVSLVPLSFSKCLVNVVSLVPLSFTKWLVKFIFSTTHLRHHLHHRGKNKNIFLLPSTECFAVGVIFFLCVLLRYRLYIHGYQHYRYNAYPHQKYLRSMDYHMIRYNGLKQLNGLVVVFKLGSDNPMFYI